MKILFCVFILIGLRGLVAGERDIDLANHAVDRFFSIDEKCIVGASEYSKKFEERVVAGATRKDLVDRLMVLSDRHGIMIRFRYLSPDLAVSLLLFGKDGLVVFQAELSESKLTKKMSVVGTAIRQLKGVYIPAEDTINSSEFQEPELIPKR